MERGEAAAEGKIERTRDGRYENFGALPPKGIEVITDRETGKVLRRVAVYG